MNLITTQARAYVNFGRWIAECPLGCGNALELQKGQAQFFCNPPGGCGHVGSVDWPSNPDELWEALDGRAPKNRNWFPSEHPLALKANCPHGQTPQELRDETEEMTRG